VESTGEKTEVEVKSEYIDEALSEFSGYIAADELYDGPFCVLFIVDNRKFNRLYYEVLDHNPTHEDSYRLGDTPIGDNSGKKRIAAVLFRLDLNHTAYCWRLFPQPLNTKIWLFRNVPSVVPICGGILEWFAKEPDLSGGPIGVRFCVGIVKQTKPRNIRDM